MADDLLPLAVRRTRRSNVGTASCSEAPLSRRDVRTPRKRVRFSDPGFAGNSNNNNNTSGLTPMVGRVSVGTPQRDRRHSSTPTKISRSRNAIEDSVLPAGGEVTFLPLRQVLDGRVQRRIRRNGLSEEMNVIQQERRRRAQQTKEEIDQLKEQLKARDREIYELQNATIIVDNERVWSLERQIEELKNELHRRSASEGRQERSYNWTLAARDPFGDDFMDMQDEFGETTVAQLGFSTPSRAVSSFPTPPATSPTVPGSPAHSDVYVEDEKPPSFFDTGIQAELPDPVNQQLEEEVASLQLEIDKLTTTLDSYKSLASRLTERLPCLPQESDAQRPTGEILEDQVEALLRDMSDRTAALTELTTCISDLGFPGHDASDMVVSLASGFRAARLELEYLTPGEIALPLTSHGAEVLDLLLTRLRNLAKKSKEDDDSIDEYHEIEQSLRKQLDARVSVMNGLKAEMAKADKLMSDKNARIRELEVGNERLKGAVNGYMRDISELENLIAQMEQDNRDAKAAHHAHVESNRRVLTSKENHIAELETKLTDALRRSTQLQKQLGDMLAAKEKEAAAVSEQHSAALARRDARVVELSSEIDRVNTSLRVAHDTIRSLRDDNGELREEMVEDSRRAKSVIDSMKEDLQRAVLASQSFLDESPRSSFGSKKRSCEQSGETCKKARKET